jgi:hypothetical protein
MTSDLRGKSEATVVKYYRGTPTLAPVIRWDGKHKKNPEIGKSVPLEVVVTTRLEDCGFRAR